MSSDISQQYLQTKAYLERAAMCYRACAGIPDEELRSNARLIAAAPDLLAACESLLRYSINDSSGARMAIESAKAALAKAGAK